MQLLTRMLDYGLDIQQAQDFPRFFPDPFSDVVDVEEAVSEDICAALRAKGHNIRRAKIPIGGSQAIWIDEETGMLVAGSDPVKTVWPRVLTGGCLQPGRPSASISRRRPQASANSRSRRAECSSIKDRPCWLVWQ